jgi:nuclear transport factor 2 (NTF2) superfamily protein
MKKPVTLENLNQKINSEDLVLRYFKGVDKEDINAILTTLTEDCVFSIETHKIKLVGHEEITSMFKRLWKNHKSVEHREFYFVKDHISNRIAVRFQVKNVLHNNQIVLKSNCNFFTLIDGIFSEVRVYMAGENTLNKEG